ncbi:unnamed protein product [Ranitomeya imitator]|uniref:S-phase kinase-associated protein 2 n=1 Tax=Ranitomeya imitator TaxID=111125 RepID=A0ABN9M3N5_9NEOB|nr:unnamed protein product [Ranitomeya imitator]
MGNGRVRASERKRVLEEQADISESNGSKNHQYCLEELNLSWCDFTLDHVKSAVANFPRSITQLNLSGYRQNLELVDVETLLQRCPNLTSLDLSDLKPLHLKTLSVFGVVTDNPLLVLKESLPHTKINGYCYSTIARPTTGGRKNRTIWGIKCRLSMNLTDS